MRSLLCLLSFALVPAFCLAEEAAPAEGECPCKADHERLCKDVEHGPEAHKCMMEKRAELSDACREKLDKKAAEFKADPKKALEETGVELKDEAKKALEEKKDEKVEELKADAQKKLDDKKGDLKKKFKVK